VNAARPTLPTPRAVRRGMTFLEIVAAAALLAVVATTIFSTFGFVTGSAGRDTQRLAAAEVANRLMLAYLDDSTHMPDSHKTVQYGPSEAPMLFRWEYREEPLSLIEIAEDQRDQTRSSPLPKDRFLYVTVHAWLSEQSGGSRSPDANTPQATLARMVDPVMPRNADSYMNMLQNPEGFDNLIKTMMGIRGGGGGGGGPARPGAKPGPTGGAFGPGAAFRTARPGGMGLMSGSGAPPGGGRRGGASQ
jgi:type II secretory pathway pseudopilin PulG